MDAQGFDTADLDTVDQVLDRAALINPEIEAYVEPSFAGAPRQAITFRSWKERADGVAAWLAELGVGRHDVVCLLLAPSIDFAVAYHGIVRLGAITSGINPRMGALEQAGVFDRLRPIVSIVEDDLVDALPAHCGRVISRSALREVPTRERPGVPTLQTTDPLAVVWTSGTTGMPKGAIFDHGSLRAVAAGTDVLSQPGDRRLSPLPFSHVSYVTRAWDEIAHGVTTIISPSPWRAQSALEVMIDEQVTVAQGVPTQWALLLELDGLNKTNLATLRVAGTGAARMPAAHVRELRERLGVPIVVRYTSTETSLGTGTRPGDSDEIVATTVGRPVSGVSISLVDEDGEPVGIGHVGRVRLSSGAVMKGYIAPRSGLAPGEPPHVDEASTHGVLSADGWVTTGDFGMIDGDGNVTLVGRDNELYQRGGYNVYPAEVERALDSLEGVRAAAVVAGEDPILGEVGVAFIVLDDPTCSLDREDVRAHVAGILADYKCPDIVRFVDELPVTAMGKIDKRSLKGAANIAAQERSDALRKARDQP